MYVKVMFTFIKDNKKFCIYQDDHGHYQINLIGSCSGPNTILNPFETYVYNLSKNGNKRDCVIDSMISLWYGDDLTIISGQEAHLKKSYFRLFSLSRPRIILTGDTDTERFNQLSGLAVHLGYDVVRE